MAAYGPWPRNELLKGLSNRGTNVRREFSRSRGQTNSTRLALEALQRKGTRSHAILAQALMVCGIPAPRGGAVWPHTILTRVFARAAAWCVDQIVEGPERVGLTVRGSGQQCNGTNRRAGFQGGVRRPGLSEGQALS